MILKTKDFQEAANKILLALDSDKSAGNLELSAHDAALYLSVTNKEFFVSVKFALDCDEAFRAVVEAPAFLTLISGLTASTFELIIDGQAVKVKAGKSSYKLPMIYENDKLMELPAIVLRDKTVEMRVQSDILESIVNVNSKELLKVKNAANVNELQKLYYISEEGCLTFTTGACMNSFHLEKPVKLLLNNSVVKLFRLLKEDAEFALGHDRMQDGRVVSKVSFQTPTVYVAAIVNYDDVMLSRVQAAYSSTKRLLEEPYEHSLVLSSTALSAAIARLMAFTKNSVANANMAWVASKVYFNESEMTIQDTLGNCEVVQIENGSRVAKEYEFAVNLADLKLVLDSCKSEHITMNCGNHRAVVIGRGAISNLIPELKARQ